MRTEFEDAIDAKFREMMSVVPGAKDVRVEFEHGRRGMIEARAIAASDLPHRPGSGAVSLTYTSEIARDERFVDIFVESIRCQVVKGCPYSRHFIEGNA